MNINALSSSAPMSMPNRFKYNGNEEQTDFDWNVYDFNARGYDAVLGRFMQVDPLSDSQESFNPYHFGYNDPIFWNDPTGLCPSCPDDGEDGDTYDYNGIGYTYTDGVWRDQYGFSHDELINIFNDMSRSYSNGGSLSQWEGSSISLTVSLVNTPQTQLSASASTNGVLQVFANVGKSGKLANFTVAGFSEQVGIQFKGGELSAFSNTQFDFLGFNHSTMVDLSSGDSNSKMSIAIKWGRDDLSLTYRQEFTGETVPHVKGVAGAYSASYMANRQAVGRGVLARSTGSVARQSTVERTLAPIDHILKAFPPTEKYVRHKQDATRVQSKKMFK
jgi:RHS repeat-associated protein